MPLLCCEYHKTGGQIKASCGQDVASPIYRITVQKLNPDGTLGELVEILETERKIWTSVFDFVDQYRTEMAADV